MAVTDVVDDRLSQSLDERAAKVAAAAEAMRTHVLANPSHRWEALELQDAVAAENSTWTSSIRLLAFWRLISNKVLKVGDDLRVGSDDHAAAA